MFGKLGRSGAFDVGVLITPLKELKRGFVKGPNPFLEVVENLASRPSAIFTADDEVLQTVKMEGCAPGFRVLSAPGLESMTTPERFSARFLDRGELTCCSRLQL